MFAGWVPDAVYTADINDLREQCETQDSPVTAFCHQLKDVEHAMTATAVSCKANIQLYVFVFVDFWSIFNVGVLGTGHIHDSIYSE